MKNVFGINITDNKSNESPDGEVFVTAKISDAQQKALDRMIETTEQTEEKKDLPLPLHLLYYLSLTAAVCCVGGVVKGLSRGKVSLAQAYQNAPAVFWIGGASIVLAVILGIFKHLRKKKVENSEETKLEEHRVQTLEASNYLTLGVPETAADLDVLTFRYKIKNGEVKPATLAVANYANAQLKAFVRDGMLCLADLSQCVSIPLDEITGIESVQKRITVLGWNKPTAYNQGEYKPYKITTDNMGVLHFKSYCAVTVSHNGETYEIFLPPYEQPVIEQLIKQ